MRLPRSRWLPLLVASTALAASGCTAATPRPDAYKERTRLAVDDAISHVATTTKVLRAADRGQVLGTYAIATVRASDADLATAVGAYTELYPPADHDRVFRAASTLLGDASDLVTESRIALYRGQTADYPRLVDRLLRLTRKLDAFDGTLS